MGEVKRQKGAVNELLQAFDLNQLAQPWLRVF
jgi:hypothetical protein